MNCYASILTKCNYLNSGKAGGTQDADNYI